MDDLLEQGLVSNINAYKSDKVANAFLESIALERALNTHGTSSAHAQFVQGIGGADTIIVSGADDKQQTYMASNRMGVDDFHQKTTLTGDLEQTNNRSNFRSVEIEMDPSRNETVTLRDINDSTLLKSAGSWTPGENKIDTGNFELTRGQTTLAKVIARREWLDTNHSNTQYTLYAPKEDGKPISSVNVDRQTNDGILDVKFKFEGK